jgi:hypothetical protein
MKNKSLAMLKTFLEDNEQNIATDEGNMGYLTYIFKDVMDRPPVNTTPVASVYRYGHHPSEQALDK